GGRRGGRGGRRGPAPDLAPGMMQAASAARENQGIAILRGMPEFEEMRRVVRANPSILPEILQQLGAVNPDLLQSIQEDPAALAAVLNEPEQGGDPEADLRSRGVARINVTPEENAAIKRLEAMGFPSALAVEAFFACDKNEDLAVNYIIQRLDEAA
ncbi:hypothetical protein PFISCL1PPCAC_4779, partial [Pristionchus fissidentatus]